MCYYVNKYIKIYKNIKKPRKNPTFFVKDIKKGGISTFLFNFYPYPFVGY